MPTVSRWTRGWRYGWRHLEDVIRNKEAMSDVTQRSSHSRTMGGLHVLMGRETLALRKKYASKWDLSIA